MDFKKISLTLTVIYFSISLSAQRTYLPLIEGNDTIGFFKGNTSNPYKSKFLFKSSKADKFLESHPDLDFEWSSDQMKNDVYLKWNPYPNISSDIFDITRIEVTTGKNYAQGTFKEISPTAIVKKEGTAKELYQLALNYINETYKSPENVIKGKVDGEYLKINGSMKNLNKLKVLGTAIYYDGRYTIEFRFKDGKFKVDIISLEYYTPPSKYVSGGWNSYRMLFRIKDKNGKSLPENWRNLYFANNYFTELIQSFKEYTSISERNTSDDDW